MKGPSLIAIGNERLKVVVDASDGARLTSIRFRDCEFLRQGVTANGGLDYGSYPMGPFAGRIAFGELNFQGETYQLFHRIEPHALHGTVLDRQWTYEGQEAGTHRFSITSDNRWPFPFELTQYVSVNESQVRLELQMTAEVEQPAWLGWHPWWKRNLGQGEALVVNVPAQSMLERVDMIPTGKKVPPSRGPWDDTFTDLAAPITLSWSHVAQVMMSSSHSWWVVYSEPADAVCVEPQSAPPHAAGLGLADIVGPGQPLTMSTTWTFSDL